MAAVLAASIATPFARETRQVGREFVPLEIGLRDQPQPVAAVIDVEHCGVIDAVLARRAHRVRAGHRHLDRDRMERGEHRRERRRLGAQCDERRVESVHVVAKAPGGVALGVNRHQDHLHALAVRAHGAPRLAQPQQRGRAHVGAAGEAEEHHDDTIAEILERALAPFGIGDAHAAAVVDARDRRGMEWRSRRRAAGRSAGGEQRGHKKAGQRGSHCPARRRHESPQGRFT
jgi:hypothetical protein